MAELDTRHVWDNLLGHALEWFKWVSTSGTELLLEQGPIVMSGSSIHNVAQLTIERTLPRISSKKLFPEKMFTRLRARMALTLSQFVNIYNWDEPRAASPFFSTVKFWNKCKTERSGQLAFKKLIPVTSHLMVLLWWAGDVYIHCCIFHDKNNFKETPKMKIAGPYLLIELQQAV